VLNRVWEIQFLKVKTGCWVRPAQAPLGRVARAIVAKHAAVRRPWPIATTDESRAITAMAEAWSQRKGRAPAATPTNPPKGKCHGVRPTETATRQRVSAAIRQNTITTASPSPLGQPPGLAGRSPCRVATHLCIPPMRHDTGETAS
jgi:hypothetical protein